MGPFELQVTSKAQPRASDPPIRQLCPISLKLSLFLATPDVFALTVTDSSPRVRDTSRLELHDICKLTYEVNDQPLPL
ncbi:hypothetical protein E4U61_002645 [Claviceps capensis]|nr:hypothetical protein E4U61_002645 [Claviceps capensis]